MDNKSNILDDNSNTKDNNSNTMDNKSNTMDNDSNTMDDNSKVELEDGQKEQGKDRYGRQYNTIHAANFFDHSLKHRSPNRALSTKSVSCVKQNVSRPFT